MMVYKGSKIYTQYKPNFGFEYRVQKTDEPLKSFNTLKGAKCSITKNLKNNNEVVL